MKLPLRYGLLSLLALFLLHAYTESEQLRLLILVGGMAIALWTAFSLKIPPRREEDRNPDLHVVEGHDESPTIGPLGESRGVRWVPDLSADPHEAQPKDGEWDAGEGEDEEEPDAPGEDENGDRPPRYLN